MNWWTNLIILISEGGGAGGGIRTPPTVEISPAFSPFFMRLRVAGMRGHTFILQAYID